MKVRDESAHKLEEILVECIFDGMKCTVENFTKLSMTNDQCFTFNPGKDGHPLLKVRGTGSKRSLLLTINIQHYDYYRDSTTAGKKEYTLFL